MNIKFRAKNLISENWVRGNYYRKWIYHANTREASFEHYIGWQVLDENNEMWNEYEEVNPKTLGLWTGITDTNGIEIYQGDIVRQTLQDHDFMKDYPNGILLEVKLGIFEEDELVPQFYLAEYGGEDVEHERETFMDCYEYEVVGNIHQGVRE